MRPLSIGLTLLVLATALACHPRERTSATRSPTSAGGDRSEGPTDAPRALQSGASYGTLLEAIRRLEEANATESSRGCLLERAPGGMWLRADLAVALRPLPPADPELEARLERSTQPVRILSIWGEIGTAPFELAMAALSSTPPPDHREAVAVLLTESGLWLRSTHGPIDPARGGPFSIDDLDEPLRSLLAERRSGMLLVGAAPRIPLERVAQLLEVLPAATPPVALALPLPAETRLPEASAGARGHPTPFCPGGLPEPPADAAEGGADPARLRAALLPLRERASSCLDLSTESASGGRLLLQLRIEADGSVGAACIAEDEDSSRDLQLCVTEAARGLRFPAPEPPGFVDVAVPLVLEPDQRLRQRPLCE